MSENEVSAIRALGGLRVGQSNSRAEMIRGLWEKHASALLGDRDRPGFSQQEVEIVLNAISDELISRGMDPLWGNEYQGAMSEAKKHWPEQGSRRHGADYSGDAKARDEFIVDLHGTNTSIRNDLDTLFPNWRKKTTAQEFSDDEINIAGKAFYDDWEGVPMDRRRQFFTQGWDEFHGELENLGMKR